MFVWMFMLNSYKVWIALASNKKLWMWIREGEENSLSVYPISLGLKFVANAYLLFLFFFLFV